jgi:hypothetical protein
VLSGRHVPLATGLRIPVTVRYKRRVCALPATTRSLLLLTGSVALDIYGALALRLTRRFALYFFTFVLFAHSVLNPKHYHQPQSNPRCSSRPFLPSLPSPRPRSLRHSLCARSPSRELSARPAGTYRRPYFMRYRADVLQCARLAHRKRRAAANLWRYRGHD